jgi:2-polyprenyl-3-methyl-5-hydroxy-6-metoxy-1,4-benzoquinol methylase
MSAGKRTECRCDLCGSDEALEIGCARLYTRGQPVHVCARCGFVYVRSRRSAEEIARSWSEEIYGAGYTARIPAVKARFTYVADFTDMHLELKGKKVCDIGAGEGLFPKILRDEYGADVFGIEPSPHNCRLLADLKIPSFQGTIEEYSTRAKQGQDKTDVVTILWTLECCRSARDMLQAAWDILDDAGHVVIGTGSRILVPFKKSLQSYFPTHALDTHPVRFSASTLRGMLAVCGFEAVHVNRYLDTDYLCVIGQKRPRGAKIDWTGDDPVRVLEFFDRWHKESLWYREAA